jgi:hypothetical protein
LLVQILKPGPALLETSIVKRYGFEVKNCCFQKNLSSYKNKKASRKFQDAFDNFFNKTLCFGA